MRPLVSVVIPTKNRASLVVQAINSLKSQSYPDWEAVVVDDGSTDETENVISSLQSARVRFFRNAGKAGAQGARNTGIREARGEWLAFLDSDDVYLATSIEVRIKRALETGCRVIHSDAWIRKGENLELYGVRPLSGNVYRDLLGGPGPLLPALLIHRDAMQSVRGLDEEIVSWQEWETSIRLAKNFEFGFVEDPTFIYSSGTPNAISADLVRDAVGYKQIMRKHQSEIQRVLGRPGLARHSLFIATRLVEAGHRWKAALNVVNAALLAPSALKGHRHLLRRLLPSSSGNARS